MKTPQFLRRLLSLPAYMDKNSDAYAVAERYLRLLYPGVLAQDELDAALEESISEVESEYEEAGRQIDVEDYVELEETIDVRVLMPDGAIENKQLEVYTLDLPEDDDDMPNGKPRGVWRWHSEDGDNTCSACASRDGEIYESEDDIPSSPLHPNCRCSITEDVIDAVGRTIGSKSYTPKAKEEKNEIEKDAKEMTKDEKFEEAYNKLQEPEGGYTDGKNQVRDEPTNMGIKQSTLDDYARKHSEKDLPSDVKNLQPSQAKEIYKDAYWDNTNIPKIENDRVRNAVFDMNVMGGAGCVVQRALNDFGNAGLAVDGKIGPKTIDALNSIPANSVSDFMETLKAHRFEYLQKTDNWPTSKNGWTKRTNKY